MSPVLARRLYTFSVITVFYSVRCPSVAVAMHERRFILNIIVEDLIVSRRCPYLLPVSTPVQSIDPSMVPAVFCDQSVLVLLHSVNIDMIIVRADGKVTLVRRVFGYFAVVLGLFKCLNFLIKIVQTPNTDFASIATHDQVVMLYGGSDCSGLLVGGHFTHGGGHLDSLLWVVII